MNFFKKPSERELQRQNQREIRKAEREIDRSNHSLANDEAKLEAQIKKAAKEGNMDLARSLAKRLVQLKQTKQRNMAMSSKVSAIGTQQKLVASNMAVAKTMGNTAQVMNQVNKQMDPQKTQQMMMNFSKESAKLDMSEEMMNDVLSDMWEEDGGAEDAVINQVLDEIGIDQTAQMIGAPSAQTSRLGTATAVSDSTKEEDEILKRLRALDS